jgi:hypothetical protein
MTQLICVDFYRTLTDPSEDEWRPAFEQKPNEEMIEKVHQSYISGNKIVIWTARKWKEAPQVAGWLTAHEVPFHGLRCGKGGADRYIDDKAERPEEFLNDSS